MQEIFNFVIETIGGLIQIVLQIFPDSPFKEMTPDTPDNVVLSYITWFIPFPTMAMHFAYFLTALALYYVVRIAARWLKLIRS